MSIFKGIFKSNNDEVKPGDSGLPKKTKSKDPISTVIRKLKESNKQAQTLNEADLTEWAKALCDPREMMEAYLTTDFLETIKQFRILDQKTKNIPEKETTSGGLLPSILTSQSEGGAQMPDKFQDEDDEDDLKELEEMEGMKNFYEVGELVKVKLVIAEICKSKGAKKLRQMLAPALTKFNQLPQFGMFHSALVIGPWYIEWNNSSLCIPRKIYSSAALISADLGSISKTMLSVEEVRKKLAEVITDWNIHRSYDQKGNNCQVFIDEILSKLNIKINFSGPLGTFLKRLRTEGVCEISFCPTPTMRENFSLKQDKYLFTSHAELDEFVRHLQKVDPQFQDNHLEEYNFLKSFDRAFWLRHLRNQNDATFAPCEEGCPFQDPQYTFSLPKMDY